MSFLSRSPLFYPQFLVAAAACALANAPSPIQAQTTAPTTTVTVKTVATFRGTTGTGVYPYGGLILSEDGNFYGTTSDGGASGLTGGTVFRLSPGGTLTTLASFSAAASMAPVIEGLDGSFYGTTTAGGKSGEGIVLRVTPDGTLSAIGAFDGLGLGAAPVAGLVQGADSNFYGTTTSGGAGGGGTIYRSSAQGGIATLHSFTASQGDGIDPLGALAIGRDGYLYGTTYKGGAHGFGTIFKTSLLGSFSTVYDFTGGSDGGCPKAGLVLGTDGNFYGTTSGQGTTGYGTVFRLTPQGALATLHRFTDQGGEGATPDAVLTDGGDGSFYGTTNTGGITGNGTIFAVTPAGDFTTLHNFSGPDGASPAGPLAYAGGGIFYGTTTAGGPSSLDRGTAYRLNLRTPPDSPGALSFSAASLSVSESVGGLSLVVDRMDGETGTVSVQYTTIDGSAKTGVDYLTVSGLLNWAAGDTKSKTIYIPIADPGVSDHSTRTFSVKLSNPTGGATLGGIPTTGIAIQEDDAYVPPKPTGVSLTVLNAGTATVGGKNATILFTRDGDTSADLTVTYQVKGSARNGVDYQTLPGKFTIPAGSAKAKLKIKALSTSPHKGTLTIKLVPQAPQDNSFLIDTPKVKVLFINNG